MGLYDTVKGVSVKCPRCGKAVKDFQTKNFECWLNTISKKKLFQRIAKRDYNVTGYNEVHLYSSCDNCKKEGFYTGIDIILR